QTQQIQSKRPKSLKVECSYGAKIFMRVRPSGDPAGQCPKTKHGNVPLALSGIQAPVGESLLPRVKEEDVYEPQRSPWGFCKGLHCSADTGSSGYGKLTFGQGTILTVHPTIQNPDPAVYQLKSPESSNISVCLFTDFDSEINVEPSTESNMTRLKSTSLDMKTMDSKSNGALAWSNSFDLGCNSTFNYTFHSSSEFPCDANVVEKGFETDMNLNFYNLLVIVLRITFLKVVGFNLLMTLRLWSS
uniref:T-cell receptor alpha chain constant domain-containing protein n=1 Tax=Panthera leo TaxID=9689 RepID=A0A8C8X214_PANLE